MGLVIVYVLGAILLMSIGLFITNSMKRSDERNRLAIQRTIECLKQIEDCKKTIRNIRSDKSLSANTQKDIEEAIKWNLSSCSAL